MVAIDLVNKEIDLLSDKIQLKLNIQMEQGEKAIQEVKALLTNQTKSMVEGFDADSMKGFKISMALMKQKLQKTLFVGSGKEDLLDGFLESVVMIFVNAVSEIQNSKHEQNKVHTVYKDIVVKE